MWQWTFNKASDFIPKECNLCSYKKPGLAVHLLWKEVRCGCRVECTQHASQTTGHSQSTQWSIWCLQWWTTSSWGRKMIVEHVFKSVSHLLSCSNWYCPASVQISPDSNWPTKGLRDSPWPVSLACMSMWSEIGNKGGYKLWPRNTKERGTL